MLVLSYNHTDNIEACINSALIQRSSLVDIEVLIIDDGSIDGSVEKLMSIEKRDPSVKVYYNEHEGVRAISRNFNDLIERASGDYISFLASDDEFMQGRFLEQLTQFNDNQVQIVYGDGLNVDSGVIKGEVINKKTKQALRSNDVNVMYEYLTQNVPLLFIQSVLVKREFLRKFKAFDEELIADDWVFNILCFQNLIATNGKYYYLDKPVFFRNRLPGRTSADLPVHWERIKQVIDKYVPIEKRQELRTSVLKSLVRRARKQGKIYQLLLFILKLSKNMLIN